MTKNEINTKLVINAQKDKTSTKAMSAQQSQQGRQRLKKQHLDGKDHYSSQCLVCV